MDATRASDADRERTSEELRAHFAAGRLEVDDLEQRLQIAVRAGTLAELEMTTRDLPGSAPAVRPVSREGAGGAGGWGKREFRQEHLLPATCMATWQRVMTHIAPAMAASGYTIVDRHEPDFIVFELGARRVWPVLLLGPLGLLAAADKSRVVVSLAEQSATQTKLVAAGTGRRAVRRAFASISA